MNRFYSIIFEVSSILLEKVNERKLQWNLMMRFVAILAVLLGFISGQVAPAFANGIPASSRKYTSNTDTSHHQVPDPSDNSSSADEEESSDSPQGDGLKCVFSQVKFQFIQPHNRILWVDPHFVPWLIVSNLDRPPDTLLS
jgi:hypothetical protein